MAGSFGIDDTALHAHTADFNEKSKAYDKIQVFCMAGLEGVLNMTFKRTVRVPDNNSTYQLPPGLGNFPIYSIAEYKKRLPKKMVGKGGVFIPMYQREAMWIDFKADRPFAIKMYVGGVNAISGEPKVETIATIARRQRLVDQNKTIQDYLVSGPHKYHQDWIDGIVDKDGSVSQFVAMPTGSEHSIEAQITGQEAIAGIQVEIMPIKHLQCFKVNVVTLTGKTCVLDVTGRIAVKELKDILHSLENIRPEQQKLSYNGEQLQDHHVLSDYDIKEGSMISLTTVLRGGGNGPDPAAGNGCPQGDKDESMEMGVAAGGHIQQAIQKDFHPADIWDQSRVIIFNVQILNAGMFSKVTGLPAPKTPVSAATYAAHNMPFFKIYEEPSGIVGQFNGVKTVAEKMESDGENPDEVDEHNKLHFPTIILDENRNAAGFLPVARMEAKIKKHQVLQRNRKYPLLQRNHGE